MTLGRDSLRSAAGYKEISLSIDWPPCAFHTTFIGKCLSLLITRPDEFIPKTHLQRITSEFSPVENLNPKPSARKVVETSTEPQ